MAEDDQAEPRRHGRVWRRVIAGLLVCVALLVLLHRPILLAIGRKIVLNYAAEHNLKANFRVEGNPFGSVTIRNLRAFAVGPSEYESIDADYLYLDYSLLGYARHGLPRLFNNVEARSATIVLNPSKAPLRPRPPHPQLKLPRFFPERLRATDLTFIVRNQPYDFVVGHANLELNPRTAGELRIETLQLPSGDTWLGVAGKTSYTNKNLILRDFVLSDQEQLHFLQIDASQIDANYLGVDLKCTVGGGQISASAPLTETKSSLDTKLHLTAEKVAAEALNKFLIIPENYLSGEIERLALEATGTIDAPRTWNGTLSLQMNDVHRDPINFDRGVIEISAEEGKAVLRSADIVQDLNNFHFQGAMELPSTFNDFGRTPTNLVISGAAPDLKRLTAGTPVGLTGSAHFNGRIDVVNATVEADLGVSAESVGFQDGIVDKLNSRLRASKRVVRGDGKRAWFADLRTAMEFTLTGIRYRDYIVDSVNGSINGTDDIVGLDLVTLRRNENELSIRGRYQLPENFGNAASQPAQLDIALNAPEIGSFWVPHSPNKVSGPLQLTAHVERKQAQIDGQVSLSGSNLKMRDLIVQHLTARASIVSNVLHLNEFNATLNDTDFAKATGTFDLQAPHHYNGKLAAQIANLSVLEPLLRAFGNEKQLAGSLKLDWDGSGELGTALSNTVALAHASPSPGAQSVPSSTTEPASPSPTAQVILQQSGTQSVSPSPNARSVSQQADTRPVSPSPTSRSISQPGGARSVSPSPSAHSPSPSPDVQSVAKLFGLAGGKNSGHLKLSLQNGRYGGLKGLQTNTDASYSPEGLEVPSISFTTDKMGFHANVRTKDDRLEIDKIQIDQGLAKFASGYISIPFVWGNVGTDAPVIPPSGKVSATVQIENLDLKKLAKSLGIYSGVSGVLNARLDASGTVADLNAQLVVQMRDLRNEFWPKMEPASFELTAQVAHNRLTALGKLQQPRIQPLEITASMPFDLRRIVHARGFPDDTPITAKARLPRRSVNFVRQFVPDLAQLDGDLGLDVDVNGTFGHPVLSGAGDMTVNVARFTNATLPTLRGFNVRFTFTDNVLTLDRFGGDLAGGPFTMTGHVTFVKLTEPILDLQMRAQSVLIARNDTLTARADGNVTVTGPFAAATVSGTIALTNSRFLKNIDLIPIGLPGRPAPQPPTERPEFFSLPGPPFRDWKFDVAIKTKDPVMIRGNLATGEATTDLKLTGTGLKPGLQGMIHMEGVEATLPFSRLDVSRGSLTFDPKDSTNPTIDLQGTSVIRDYTVRVYVYGTLLAPQAIFTSEPPLPQEEIISLIATGTTRRELSTGNVLAGRAAMLLVQQLYRKIVKKGEPTDSNTVFNRLDLDLGTVDPRTGQQQATVRFKITDQLVLTGDVGVRGDFRGKLKYLIRFR